MDELLVVRRRHDGAHLALRVDRVDARAGGCVPESEVTVGAAATGRRAGALTALVCAVSASVHAKAVRLNGRGVRGERERSR